VFNLSIIVDISPIESSKPNVINISVIKHLTLWSTYTIKHTRINMQFVYLRKWEHFGETVCCLVSISANPDSQSRIRLNVYQQLKHDKAYLAKYV